MQRLDLTLNAPEENLALDEVLLEWCEQRNIGPILRFWESPRYFVVLGHSNKIQMEVKVTSCQADSVPILRRISGGGTVLQGPGCLNYALILPLDYAAPLGTISETTCFIVKTHKNSLTTLLSEIAVSGVSDLTYKGLKFSGNAQRRQRRYLLFHGTFLTGFDLSLIEKYLSLPSIQPEYRRNREHRHFLTSIPLSSDILKERLIETWKATDALSISYPGDMMDAFLANRYSQESWHSKF